MSRVAPCHSPASPSGIWNLLIQLFVAPAQSYRRSIPLVHTSCRRFRLLAPSKRSFSSENNVLWQQHKVDEALGHLHAGKLKEREAERDLFLSVLSATATKREAKDYLARFTPPSVGKKSVPQNQKVSAHRQLRIALIKIRALQELDNFVVEGLAHTFSQLARLGLNCVVVVDNALDDGTLSSPTWREDAICQADRLVTALQKEASIKACRLEYALGITPNTVEAGSKVSVRGDLEVQYPEALFRSLRSGTIPVIPSIGYTTETQKIVQVEADDVVLALTRQFAGLRPRSQAVYPLYEEVEQGPNSATQTSSGITVDRIILLDPLGGLPSATRPDSAHIFINLEQEYDNVRRELLGGNITRAPLTNSISNQTDKGVKFSLFGASNPFSKLLETEQPLVISKLSTDESSPSTTTNRNVRNLDLLQRALAILPPQSSALLTTPYEASTKSTTHRPDTTDLGVITRRPRNPLIYNLLTDKPLVSSSLPVSRIDSTSVRRSAIHVQPNSATFVKRGMPITMIPNPLTNKWEAPDLSVPQLGLDDPRLDLPRLLNLIEDSFGRPLNVEHYLNRIRNKIAGVIVAGEYEGGAILTWELPPGVPDDGSEESRRRMVPYLDKFAVLKRSQGAGGVADMVFTAMVRSCFPSGVCWRSRKDNPVNKWYFERSIGTRKLPGTNWTMFWTTEGLVQDQQGYLDYEGVCRDVQPSWADGKLAD